MDALTQLVLLITLAAIVLYALYWVVRRAVRDQMAEAARTVQRSTDEPQS